MFENPWNLIFWLLFSTKVGICKISVGIFFTDFTLWAWSVIESPCPFVSLYVTKVVIVFCLSLRNIVGSYGSNNSKSRRTSQFHVGFNGFTPFFVKDWLGIFFIYPNRSSVDNGGVSGWRYVAVGVSNTWKVTWDLWHETCDMWQMSFFFTKCARN